MAALTFLDTNVIAYAYDASAGAKHSTAIDVLSSQSRAVVSAQVLSEVFSVLTRKLGLASSVAREVVDRLSALEVVATDARLVREAIDLAITEQISHWDAMIVLAAARAGCDSVLTEDLNNGQVIAGVRIVNPFVADIEREGAV